MKKTLCLNMIVKNESHIIESTLQNILDHIHIDYWVICDTGSTDNTIDIIETFFRMKQIPGKIHQNEWKDFGYNRSKALEYAFNKTDYVLIFDADDLMHGAFDLPKDLTKDMYYIPFEKPTSYHRAILVTNRKRWKYNGVLHEYIVNMEPIVGEEYLDGDYHVESRRLGNRNQNPDKYLHDAIVLEKGFEDETEDIGLKNRYAYYCAQSFQDAGRREKAIEWYEKTLTLDYSPQYKYCACIRGGDCYHELNKYDKALYLWGKAYDYDNERLEGVTKIMEYYYNQGIHFMVSSLYNTFKHITLAQINEKDKIFLDYSKYIQMHYYASISGCYCKEQKSAYEACKFLLLNRWHLVENTISNLQFYMSHFREDPHKQPLIDYFLRYLKDDTVSMEHRKKAWGVVKEVLQKECIKEYTLIEELLQVKTIIKSNTKEYTQSKNILIYTGFMHFPWNDSTLQTKALGGSEKAVIYLTRQLPKDYTIYVCGDQEDEDVDNIKYRHQSKLQELLDRTIFRTVIVSRYVCFFQDYHNIKCHQLVLSLHDTHLINHKNLRMEDYNESIDIVICLTEWHKSEISRHNEMLKDKITLINNGIIIPEETKTIRKKPNTFIWSSCANRGLDILLDVWPSILKKLPDATLNICSYETFPKNDEEKRMEAIINRFDSINHLGKINSSELCSLEQETEYWLYTTTWPETSCISAMEMLLNEVICIYYPVAALVNTLGDYGISIQRGEEINTIMGLTEEKKTSMRNKGKAYALSCSWENRAKQWCDTLGLEKKWIFYCSNHFMKQMIHQYIDNLNLVYPEYKISLTSDRHLILNSTPSKVTFVYEVFDKSIMNELEHTSFSFLNTEPLNIPVRLNDAKRTISTFPNMVYYDYSKSNLKILEEKNIQVKEAIYLPYQCDDEELANLVEWNKNTKKEYDFGIIKSLGGDVTPRRLKVVQFLRDHHYTVHVIQGWGDDRDKELAKCKVILNIHGFHDIPSQIFEHIRCDRLLEAGFTILSEQCFHLDEAFISKYKKLKQITYEAFFNENKIDFDNTPKLKKIIIFGFPHSGTTILKTIFGHCENVVELINETDIIKDTLHEKSTVCKVAFADKKYFGKKYDDYYKIFIMRNPLFIFSSLNIRLKNCVWDQYHNMDNYFKILDLYQNIINDPPPNTFTIRYEDIFENNYEILKTLFQKLDLKYCDATFENTNYNNKFYTYVPIVESKPELNAQTFAKYRTWQINQPFVNNNDINKINLTRKQKTDLLMNQNVVKLYPNIYQLLDIPKKQICFIHSCHMEKTGTKRLDYLIRKIKESGLLEELEAVYINNIGISINCNYGNKFHINNESEDPSLFEIPTLNKVITFSQSNPNCNILYLHTKGLRHDAKNKKENDWIDMMLYFTVEQYEICLQKLDENIDVVGCDYYNSDGKERNPKHFSGNFWWANTHYLSTLPLLKEVNQLHAVLPGAKYGGRPCHAEFLVCKNNPRVYEMHNCKINHYMMEYPGSKYRMNDSKKEIIKIIDCFTFYNELDLLKYRLNILNDCVDYFVLVEATHTHVGKEKPLFYQNNKNLFSEFDHKIIHVIVDDFPHKHPYINIKNKEQWINEKFQRKCISRGLGQLMLKPNDVITITDLDEIPNPNILNQIKKNEILVTINKLEMDFYYYNLNSKMDHCWYHAKILTFERLNELDMNCERVRFHNYCSAIEKAGWHLSYFGNKAFIKNKLENFGHQEYNKNEFIDEVKIEERINGTRDLFDRNNTISKIPINDNTNLPPDYSIFLAKYYTIERIVINIITRTGKRHMHFDRLQESIKVQKYDHIRDIKSIDTLNCNLMKQYDDVIHVTPQKEYENAFENIYLNKLVRDVSEGWVIFLNDDSTLIDNSFIDQLAKECAKAKRNDVLIYQTFIGPKKLIIPKRNLFEKQQILRGNIHISSFCAHFSLFKSLSFDARNNCDFHFFEKIRKDSRFNFKFVCLPIGIWTKHNSVEEMNSSNVVSEESDTNGMYFFSFAEPNMKEKNQLLVLAKGIENAITNKCKFVMIDYYFANDNQYTPISNILNLKAMNIYFQNKYNLILVDKYKFDFELNKVTYGNLNRQRDITNTIQDKYVHNHKLFIHKHTTFVESTDIEKNIWIQYKLNGSLFTDKYNANLTKHIDYSNNNYNFLVYDSLSNNMKLFANILEHVIYNEGLIKPNI